MSESRDAGNMAMVVLGQPQPSTSAMNLPSGTCNLSRLDNVTLTLNNVRPEPGDVLVYARIGCNRALVGYTHHSP
eukprot:1034637-Pyramimonas_sp.AAC.1